MCGILPSIYCWFSFFSSRRSDARGGGGGERAARRDATRQPIDGHENQAKPNQKRMCEEEAGGEGGEGGNDKDKSKE